MTAASGGLPTRPLRGEQLDSYCPPQLFKAELVYIKVGASKPPLQPLYEGPYRVIRAGQKVFVVDIGGRPQSVTVDRLKPHLGAAPAAPAAPPRRLAATGLEDESAAVQPASCKRGSRLRGACVADGQKIPQVICTEISRLNIQKSGRSFYAIFSPVYIELSLR